MASRSILVLLAVSVAVAYASHHGHHDYYAKPKYHFKYGVDDPKHGDHHSQWEERDGDKVRGGYSVKEADGTWRHVTYSSDKENGFNAVVERRGKASHPHGHHHGQYAVSERSASASASAASSAASGFEAAPLRNHESLENYPDGAYGYIG